MIPEATQVLPSFLSLDAAETNLNHSRTFGYSIILLLPATGKTIRLDQRTR